MSRTVRFLLIAILLLSSTPASASERSDQVRLEFRASLPKLGDAGEMLDLLREFEPETYRAFEDRFVAKALASPNLLGPLAKLSEEFEEGILYKREAGGDHLGQEISERIALQFARAPQPQLDAFVMARNALTPLVVASEPAHCLVFSRTYGGTVGVVPLPADRGGVVAKYRAARRALFAAAASHPVERERLDDTMRRAVVSGLEQRGGEGNYFRRTYDDPAFACEQTVNWFAVLDGMGPEIGVRFVLK